jgi:hypothetical protein
VLLVIGHRCVSVNVKDLAHTVLGAFRDYETDGTWEPRPVVGPFQLFLLPPNLSNLSIQCAKQPILCVWECQRSSISQQPIVQFPESPSRSSRCFGGWLPPVPYSVFLCRL